MKKLLLITCLLVSTSAYATFPTNIMQRPAGFKDRYVEGIRVKPTQGCTWTQFTNELSSDKTNTEWPYKVERKKNVILSNGTKVQYAVVFSGTDEIFTIQYLPDTGGPIQTTSYQTTSDGNRLNTLRNLQKTDKNMGSLNPWSKSKGFREALVVWYKQKFDDRTSCIDFAGFEYKVQLAAADTIKFAKDNANYGPYVTEYGLNASDQARQGTIVIIDGTVNTNGLRDPSRVEVVTTDDLDGKPFIKQAYSDEVLAANPGDRLESTVNNLSQQHANNMVNFANEVSKADIIVLPTAPGGGLDLFSVQNTTLMNATIDSIEKSLAWTVRHAVEKNIQVVAIPADLPPEGDQKQIYDYMDQLRDMNVTVTTAAGNMGIEEVAAERTTYPDLAGSTYTVGGSPDITVGILGPDGMISSDYGNPIDAVLEVKEGSRMIENYAPGGLTSSVDVTLTSPDIASGATGGSSYAAVLVASLAIDLKAKFPWMTSDQFKAGLINGLYNNRPDLSFLASQIDIDIETHKWEKVHGGIIDAKMLADYIKATYGKYPAVPEADAYIRDPAEPLHVRIHTSTYYPYIFPTAEAACNNILPANNAVWTYTVTVIQQPTFPAPGICRRTSSAVNNEVPVTSISDYPIVIDQPHKTVRIVRNSVPELLTEMNDPAKSLYNGRYIFEQDVSRTNAWYVRLVDVWDGDGVISPPGDWNILGPDNWRCNVGNTWGGTLIPATGTIYKYCKLPD